MRTQENRTIDYLDGLERDKIFMQVIKVGQNQRFARIWSPYKELQYTVESTIQKKQSDAVQDLESSLRKHKADFISLLQNPAKNAAHREVIRKAYKEGLPVHGQQGTRLLSQQFIQEALTLSDLFDLNEYAAVELLMAGESQQPFFPGFKRGLVAVLLYYDGRSSLVSTLRTLIQARKGRTWSLGLPEDILSVIMNFTVQLMNEGLATKILYLMQTLDVTKELDRLQSPQFRALGSPRHRRQVADKIKEIKLTLADCLFCWCCQSPLSKTDTQALISYLQTADDDGADGTLSDVTIRLLMALLYSIDPRVPEDEQGPGLPKLPIFIDPSYVPSLTDDILSDKKWTNQGLHGIIQFAWAITLHTLSQYTDLQGVTEYFEKDEMLVDLAVEQDVFSFLRNSVLGNPGFHSEEYYVRQMHNIVTDFIVQMPLKMKEMRNRGDETSRIILANQQNGLEPPAGLRRDFEHFLFLIGDLYMKDSPDRELALEFWYLPDSVVTGTTPAHNTPYTYRPPQRQISLYKFVRLAGDLLSPPLFIPYLYMLRGLANGHQCAHHCFNLLQNNGIGGGSQVNNVSWDHFFMSMHQYYTNLRQELPMTSDLAHVYRHRHRAISSQEVDGLIAVVQLLRQIAFWDDHARLALCENPHWHLLVVLLGLVSCDIPAKLKAELLHALAAFCKTPDIAATLWQSLEASQVELEEIEARDEEFPITRGFLELMNAITDNSIPAGLGSGYRVPGFAPYLEFLRDNILLKFNTRAYRNPAEKWEVGMMVLEVLYKILADYEVSASDFLDQPSEVRGETGIVTNKRPGFILMEHMLNDSNMLKMILYIIDEATKMLDKYIPFPGKEHLEQAALWCLKMIEATCNKQEEFLNALRESNSDIIVSQMDKLLMSINRRSGKADHLVNLAKYVTYNSWLIEHALSAVHILSLVSSSPIVYPHIVGLFTADQEISQHILHGFVECLENPEEPEDLDIDSLTIAEDTSAGQIRNATRQEILRLILCTLNQPAPNLAHYLLGFEIRKPVVKSDLQDPGNLFMV
ncbi:hypothetical protein LSH36_623g00003 [Paralvinella palmiformis]|uniref:Nuclear pore complex protein Nup205 n=1 Tax=Paralvinella palmiformis TaxID=53620 RepID=A0AAD9J5H0_9ANNE|nr:hypothetical protein LSH36_623g00003 [Paralvinella palmiformis]